MAARVLYIDDKPELPSQIEEVLGQAGYQLSYTSDPAEAMRSILEESPALVLTEVLFPDADGFEWIEKIGRLQVARSIPVVVVTRGERTPELYGQALELGVEEFICKPLSRAQVLEAVLAFARADPVSPTDATTTKEKQPDAPRIAGDLARHPLPELLGQLHRAGTSGVLTLRCGTHLGSLEFRNGSPVEVERHRNVKPIADFLLETRRIDATQYEILVDQLMARVAGPREILLGMQAISESGLVAANYEQGRAVVLEMCEWSPGQYEFVPGTHLEGNETIELNHNPIELILAGLSRLPEAVVRSVVEHHGSDYVSISPSPATSSDDVLGKASLSPEQCTAARTLTGDRTLAEVVSSSVLEGIDLYKLFSMGVVEFDEFPVLMLDQELKAAEEEEDKEREPSPPPEPSLTIRKLPDQAPRTRTDAAPRTIAEKIDEIASRLDCEDDFGLFGIDVNALDAEVRTSYTDLLEKLSGERISPDHEGLRARAEELRSRIESAYQRVRTEDLRRAFSGLRRRKKPMQVEAPPDGNRAIDAENWFRTGEGYLQHEDFGQAAEAFGMALHLDPEQGDYAAHLGYSLYRSNPGNSIIRREALEHVAKGVKLAPRHEKPLLFLSRIFRETGNETMAEKVLRRALKLNPDSPALIQEMCVVGPDSSQSKGKGLLGRFRRR
jgi:CheY-like chemotaxis protein/tetratricopeptide (TPR) repeat protein